VIDSREAANLQAFLAEHDKFRAEVAAHAAQVRAAGVDPSVSRCHCGLTIPTRKYAHTGNGGQNRQIACSDGHPVQHVGTTGYVAKTEK
jgi:hypothetical protein